MLNLSAAVTLYGFNFLGMKFILEDSTPVKISRYDHVDYEYKSGKSWMPGQPARRHNVYVVTNLRRSTGRPCLHPPACPFARRPVLQKW